MGGQDMKFPKHQRDETAMAADNKTPLGVPIANRGKTYRSCTSRGFDYRSVELSKLMLGAKQLPEGVGVYVSWDVVKKAQGILADGLASEESKLCVTVHSGPGCTGTASNFESSQHRCNSKATIYPAQTGAMSLGAGDNGHGMAVQCMPRSSGARRLMGSGPNKT